MKELSEKARASPRLSSNPSCFPENPCSLEKIEKELKSPEPLDTIGIAAPISPEIATLCHVPKPFLENDR